MWGIIFSVIGTIIGTALKLAGKKKALEKLGFIPVTSQRMIDDLFNSVYFPFKDLYKDSFLTQKNKTSIMLNCKNLDIDIDGEKYFVYMYTGQGVSKPSAINITIKNPFFQDSGNFRTYFSHITTRSWSTGKDGREYGSAWGYWILAAVGTTGLKSSFYIMKELPAAVKFLMESMSGANYPGDLPGLDSEFDKEFFVQALARENGPIILHKNIQKFLLEKGLPFFGNQSSLALTPGGIWIQDTHWPPDTWLIISERVVLLRELMNILIRI